MEDKFSLSPDLQKIEQRIAQGRFEPPACARAQILAEVHTQLAKPQAARAIASRRWAFAGAVAAALLIGANLSMIGASVTRFLPVNPLNNISVGGTAIAQTRSPDLIDDDPRISIVLSSPRNLPAIPSLPSPGRPADFDLSPQGITP